MAESLAALGVAANIAQFVELGLKAAVSIVKIYRSINDDGWTAHNANLDLMAKDLRNRCDRLKKDTDVKLDPTMVSLLKRCNDTADELSSELRGLVGESATKHQTWAKLIVSFAAYFKRSKIEAIQARLLDIKTQVFEHIQILLYEGRISLTRSMRSLEEVSKSLSQVTEKRLSELARDLSNLRESQSATAASTEGLRIYIETWLRVSDDAQNQATVVAILTSLRFTQIKERQNEIPKAHRQTFEWIFSDNSPVYLSPWLRNSSGLFWITGKPGSGKSTLMKFILGHEQTTLLAECWASPEPLIVASHFFWSAGTSIQKSQEGLLRTLLFQILMKCPEIIPLVCPTRYSDPFKRLESWGIDELSEVFGRLKDIRPLPSRILLLIDGLDEYNGIFGDLVQFLRSTSASPYIKICCASRPWPVFLNGFESVSGRIHMHELTANDMMRYVRDTLDQNSNFEMLKQSQETEAAKLVKDIAEKSEGVFFWVSLVVKSLLRGLDNGDDLAVLQQRLSEFPSDLDRFFQRMLDTIDGVYKENVAMVFSMLLLASSSLPLVLFVELKRLVARLKDYENSYKVKPKRSGISLRTNNPDYNSRVSVLSELLLKEAQTFSETLGDYRPSEDDFSIAETYSRKREILSQCRDLVQAWEVEGPYDRHYKLRLGFLHRTVVEFLERVAKTQWPLTLPFKRYLLARSYLSFVSNNKWIEGRAREFLLRFLYTLQGADLQEIVESQHLTGELFNGLFPFFNWERTPLSREETAELKILLTQARARTLIAGIPRAWRSFGASTIPLCYGSPRMGYLPWFLCDSAYIEVGDWAQVSWPRVVDLEILHYFLSHLPTDNMRSGYPNAFSRFLVFLSHKMESRPRNDLEVCKMLIEHGFAGPMERGKRDTLQGMSPVQIVSEGASDSKLTQSSTIKWLRENEVFSESGLRELEEAFPLESASTLMTLQDQEKKENSSKELFRGLGSWWHE
ncbi:hypothetical protein LZ32DRAFT_563385 [Colletotrichum eremochloae]|nr:hypothetical protein LZ32DRAFT_563385 [Colletotrichum eremochloae]